MRKTAFVLAASLLVLAASGCGGGGAETTTAATGPTKIEITVNGGKPAGGITNTTVKKGDQVELVVHSDVAEEIHLHGYDLKQDVDAGGTATIAFTADIAGVFEAELEHAGLQILELTVE